MQRENGYYQEKHKLDVTQVYKKINVLKCVIEYVQNYVKIQNNEDRPPRY